MLHKIREPCNCASSDGPNIYIELDRGVIVNSQSTEYEEYSGNNGDPVFVTPKAWEDQVLHTKGKVCTEDIVIQKIPYSETTNPSGSYTIYIDS